MATPDVTPPPSTPPSKAPVSISKWVAAVVLVSSAAATIYGLYTDKRIAIFAFLGMVLALILLMVVSHAGKEISKGGKFYVWLVRGLVTFVIIYFMALTSALFPSLIRWLTNTAHAEAIVPKAAYPVWEVLSRTVQLDLRQWQHVRPERKTERIAKAVWDNVFTVRKANSDSEPALFTHRYSTSGLEPEFSSDTHPGQLTFDRVDDYLLGRPNMLKYNVSVNVTNATADVPFKIHMRAVFWNEHTGLAGDSDCISVTQPTRRVEFKILFPASKQPKNIHYTKYPRIKQAKEEPICPKAEDLDLSDPSVLVWRIHQPELNYVYKAYWEW